MEKRPETETRTINTETSDLEMLAWAQSNRKALTTIGLTLVVIAIGVGLFFLQKSNKEENANAALGAIRLMPLGTNLADPAALLAVADQDAGTRAAERALILVGGVYFDQNQFDKAHDAFERFLREYPESSLTPQAMLGLGASLEGSGKFADAATQYEKLTRGEQNTIVLAQAKSALARCDLALNKPEAALAIYDDLTHSSRNDTWSAEARIQSRELLVKYPNLAKPKTNAVPAFTAPKITIPTATLSNAATNATAPAKTNK